MNARPPVLIVVASLLMGLAACSDGGSPTTADSQAPAAATAQVSWSQVYEDAKGTPEAFVNSLYRLYAEPEKRDPRPEKGRDPLYSRVMNALIGEDMRRGSNWLKVDPVCHCQPGDAVALNSVDITSSDATNATAVVDLTVAGQPVRQTLKLVKEGPMWRIEDAQIEGQPSLSDQLYKAIG